MTADEALPERPGGPARAWIAVALVVLALAAIGGWLYTVRELNRLAAYRSVGAEALRMVQSARAAQAPVPAIYAGKWE